MVFFRVDKILFVCYKCVDVALKTSLSYLCTSVGSSCGSLGYASFGAFL